MLNNLRIWSRKASESNYIQYGNQNIAHLVHCPHDLMSGLRYLLV